MPTPPPKAGSEAPRSNLLGYPSKGLPVSFYSSFCHGPSSVPPGKVNSRRPSSSAMGSAASRCAADRHEAVVAGVERLLAEIRLPNQDRIAGVRSGGLRCLVQRTSAAGAHRLGRAATVAWMSLSLMLPKMPHATTIWAGTAPAQASVVPASACSTSTPCSPAVCTACHASATLRSSNSTSRARTSSRRGCPVSAPITSRPCPAHRLIRRTSPAGARSSSARRCPCTSSPLREQGAWIVVVPVPFHPITLHDPTTLQAAASRLKAATSSTA